MTAKSVALITGAGSGMGQLAARRAIERGFAVAALDVNAAGLDQLGESPDLLKLTVDITNTDAVERAVDTVERELGPIHSVTNAAGIMPLGLLNEQPAALIHKIMAINYGGLVNISKACLPRMLARGHGDFISYASMVAHLPILYMGAYTASKFAVGAYSEVLYHENRNSGLRFACVCPPAVATPLLQQARDTVWPKMFDSTPAVRPEQVLDAVDRALADGEFWVFVDATSRLTWRLRRWVPSLLWKRVHAIEGR